MALKPKQRLAAEISVSEPDLSGMKIAERVGVDVNTYYKWKKNPEFQDYVHELCQIRFKNIEAIAIKKLKENVNKGNQKSIEYVLNYMGFKPEEKIDITSGDICINITGEENDQA